MKFNSSAQFYNTYIFEYFSPVKVKDRILKMAEKSGIIVPVYRQNEISLAWLGRIADRLGIDVSEYVISGGLLIHRSSTKNTTVNEGLDDILDKYWKGSNYTATHYVGLTGSTPTVAAGDTMSSHAGWTEVTAYSEANRQDLTLGTVASQSVDNSSSKAAFSINSDSTTVGGGFITTDNTKGGTAGTLIGGAADSGGDQTVNSGSTINMTATLTASSS